MSYWDQSSGDARSAEAIWEKLSQVAVQGAEHDSPERQPHSKCLEGTRVNLLDHIYRLLDNQEGSRLIWLHGTAGVGKSAVAFTVAERMRGLNVTEQTTSEKRLAGTFFFSRKYTRRLTTGYFFATLAYQLASNFPSIRYDVKTAIRENPALLDPKKSVRVQMEELFVRPLRELRLRLHECPPLVFVVDALDECTSEAEMADLISLLGQALRKPDLPVIHILLTSRSEAHIREAIQNEDVHPLVCEIPVQTSGEGVSTLISLEGADVDKDIYIFLKHSFTKLRSRSSIFPQPTEVDLARLASRAGRRFIVASTMMKFIDDGYNDPRKRLQLMLELTSKLLPGTEVYKFYDHILSTCAVPERAYLHLSVVAALADPLPISQIVELLGPGEGRDVGRALAELRSVMDVPTDSNQPVNIYHSSVRDYVSNPSNCGLFTAQSITPPHSLLAYSSLCLMVQEIPESTDLSDALLELQRHSQAMPSHEPQGLRHSLAFIVQPLEPLRVIITLLWLRGDRSSGLQSWLETPDGSAWMQTETGSRDWLKTRGGQDWLQTQSGGDWLQSQGGRNWLQSQGGGDWLQSQGGRDWLQTLGGGDWLQIQVGRDWLQTQGGRSWLQTQGGRSWLQTQGGRSWLQTQGGREWLQTRGGRDWVQIWGGRDWVQTRGGRDWLRTQGGRHWLHTQDIHDWLHTQGRWDWLHTQDHDWLHTQGGQDWLQTLGGRDWLQTQGGRDWLQTQGGRDWLQTQGRRDWLQTQVGRDWLQTHGGRDWLQTHGGRDWLQTHGGRDWLHTQGGRDWLHTQGGRDWLQTQGGRYWLRTQRGRDWWRTQRGRDWLHTQRGRDWLRTQRGRDWLQTQEGRDWLQTQDGQDWLGSLAGEWHWRLQSVPPMILQLDFKKRKKRETLSQVADGDLTTKALWPESTIEFHLPELTAERSWLDSPEMRNCLQTPGGRRWLQTPGGQEWLHYRRGNWLQTPIGREWLQTAHGQAWLQTPHGQAWQSTPAALFEEFSSTVEAISEFATAPESSFLPAFRAIERFKSLPDFLMFPVFLTLNNRNPTSATPLQGNFPRDMEIVQDIMTFICFANGARERSRSTSDTLAYACQNWAMHLSRAPNPWDDTLDHIFKVFCDHHLLPWLERQWCLRGLPSCLVVLSEGRKLAKEHL